MTLVSRSPLAEFDLQEIWLTIAADNSLVATRIVETIGTRITSLAEHPRLGARRRDIAATARVLVEGPYLILYETHPDTEDGSVEQVEIVRVVDGRRNLTALF